MPRIEVIPDNWKDSPEAKRGDGTPTIDMCRQCGRLYDEGDELPLYNQQQYPNGRCGSTDVAHPPYDECVPKISCCTCGDSLDESDN